MTSFQIIEAILSMAKDDNQGLRMSATITDVYNESRGTIVSFGCEKEPVGKDIKLQYELGLPGRFLAVALFIDRE